MGIGFTSSLLSGNTCPDAAAAASPEGDMTASAGIGNYINNLFGGSLFTHSKGGGHDISGTCADASGGVLNTAVASLFNFGSEGAVDGSAPSFGAGSSGGGGGGGGSCGTLG